MSAIWGTLSYHETPASNIDNIMKTPYQEKCKIDAYHSQQRENCYMGCGIQYITSESIHERLPIADEEHGFILTADCLLDNRQELFNKLSLTDTSMPDGEIVYHAYLKWGIECVKQFQGLFAIAVWDKQKDTLYLASDRLANRCLYYYHHKNGISFSTLLAPLLALHPDITPNEMFYQDYLMAPALQPLVIATDTPYQDVFKLPPATILTVTPSKLSMRTYWSAAEPLEDCHCKTAAEYGMEFRKLLTQCVSDAIRNNGKTGIALSSGYDSASVGTIAADLIAPAGRNLYAYTYTPSEKLPENSPYQIYDETDDVMNIIAMHPNILPHFLCNEGKNAIETIPEGLDTLEFPYKAFVNYPNLNEIYENASKDGCKIVLTGQHGNLSISYGDISSIAFDLYLQRKYITLCKYLLKYAKHERISRKKFLPSSIQYLRNEAKKMKKQNTEYALLNPFLSDKLRNTYPLQERFRKGNQHLHVNQLIQRSRYQKILEVYCLYSYLGECDTKLGLKHGIILRDPTCDSRILQFCYHMPYEYFTYNGTPRWLIRENMRDLIPNYLLDNWHRRGVQNKDWLLRIERDWDKLKPLYIETIRSDSIRPYINLEKIYEMINADDFTFDSEQHANVIALYMPYILALFMNKQDR